MRVIRTVLRRNATLTRQDMAKSVQNAANYKQKRVEPERQLPFRPLYLDGAVSKIIFYITNELHHLYKFLIVKFRPRPHLTPEC